jgi:hypothetical protein
MLKKITLLCAGLLALNALMAQDLDKLSPTTRTKLEDAIKKRGRYPEPIDYQDAEKKVFDAVAGHTYGVYFLYDINSTAKRETIVYRLDESGKRVESIMPNLLKGVRDGSRQLFYIVIDRSQVQGDGVEKYEVSTNSAARVVLYKIDKGL